MHRALPLTPQSGAWDFSLTLWARVGLCEITSCLKIVMAGMAGRLYSNCEVSLSLGDGFTEESVGRGSVSYNCFPPASAFLPCLAFPVSHWPPPSGYSQGPLYWLC